MERHVRRERAAGECQDLRGNPRVSGHHRSHESSHKVSRVAKEVSIREPHRDSTYAKLPKDLVAKPLNGEADYVRRWLAHTDNLTNQDLDYSRWETSSRQQYESGQSYVKSKFRLGRQEQEEEELPPIRKRKRHSSSDSSILAVPIKRNSQPLNREKDETSTERRDKPPNDFRENRRSEPFERSSLSPFAEESPPKETFERRARHKTREDKHESKTSKKAEKDGTKQKSRKKKEKRNEGKRAARESGEELMNKFSSRSIGQERLTIRPAQGLGLFNNGRASSPTRRRGLSDLAFSEMNFLQQSNRQPQAEQKSKVSSKWREKEKRKASRAQEEITEFFKPSRRPLEEVHLNKDRRASSTRSAEKSSIYVKQVDQENRLHGYSDIRSLDSRERPLVGLRQLDLSSNRLTTYGSVSPVINNLRNHHRSASKASEKATTYFSWSETQLSPSAVSYRQTIDRTQASPTPASVRRSLEDTGIFKDTGIERSADRLHRHRGEGPSLRMNFPPMPGLESAQHRTTRHNETGKPSAEFNNGLCPQSRDERQNFPEEQLKSQPRKSIRRPETAVPEHNHLQETGTTRTRVVIEHYDPARGWHESPKLPLRCVSSDLPQESRKSPVDRQELGNAARIKRPSKTLPFSRVPAKETEEAHCLRGVDHGANSHVSIAQGEHNFISPEESNNPYAKQKSMPQRALEPEEDTKSEYEMHNFHPNAHGHATKVTQPIAIVKPAEENPVESVGTLSFLGLPVRGSWEPLQVDQNRQSTPLMDKQPHFLHQMQQEAPILNDDAAVYQEVTDYEIYDIPEEDELVLFPKAYEDHEVYEHVVAEASVGYGAYMNVQRAFDDGEYSSVINHPSIVNHSPLHTYENLEPYNQGDDNEEVMYEDEAIVDEELRSQELEVPFQVIDEDYDNPDDVGVYEQTQGFWRPQAQYW